MIAPSSVNGSGLPPARWTPPNYDLSKGASAMNNQRYDPEFTDEAVRQIVDRGYSVAEDSGRLVVSTHRLYEWVK
jgi:transposase-like protein